ncbi:MAG: dihydroxyacetone kinase subunit DhaK [Clostridia bacterium]|nr:dihydroxyacetone kinase subunit DhaK [Clostridia bacterium]MBR2918836.1 dihydroxyacetone kinase subunit DhaK [Clostridia bacterium]
MKKIMNTPETFVYDMCHGLALAHPELEFVEKFKIVKKKDIDDNKVSLISGGGSGHEPAHAGFVGKGMIDCAVCGDVFASPSQVQVYNAIKKCATDKGVLLVIKNYSGDCMNFNNAMADAQDDGIKVDAVYVNDDIAVKDSLYTVGRRGVAGTVLVHKCAGAAAEQGKELDEVKRVANKVIDNVRSFGFAFTSCTVPAAGHPTFEIGDDEMEFGVGIHGEPGRYREKIDYSKGTFADDLARRILTDLEEDLGLKAGEDVVLLINGFGGTPLQELYLLNNSVTKAITADGINVHRTIVGNFMTSIDMAGASISVLRVDSELKALVDYPVSTPALTWGAAMSEQAEAALEAIKAIGKALGYTPAEPAKKASKKAVAEAEDDNATYEVEGTPVVTETINTAAFVQIVDKMADVIIENEVPFCEADQMGDGDFGMSIAKGFKQLKADWATRKKGDVGEFLVSCSEIIKEYCGGASGPIWGSAFKYAGKAMLGKKEINLTDLAFLFMEANRGVYETGKKSFGKGADIGDKTLVDALKPCALALTKAAEEGKALREGIDLGAKAAHEGAEATKTHVATLGRAGTVGERSIGFPDAGAHGLDVIFNELAAYIKTL